MTKRITTDNINLLFKFSYNFDSLTLLNGNKTLTCLLIKDKQTLTSYVNLKHRDYRIYLYLFLFQHRTISFKSIAVKRDIFQLKFRISLMKIVSTRFY